MSVEDALHRWLGAYMSAPEWLRNAAGVAYRNVPARLKHGARFNTYRVEARRHLFSAPTAAVEARLAHTLDLAAREVPAYASMRAIAHDRRSAFERLALFEPVSKADIKRDLQRFLSTARPPSDRLKMFTGGSTAEPMLFYLERSTTRPRETAYIEHIDQALLGRRPGEWIANLRGRTVRGAARDDGAVGSAEPIRRHLLLSCDHLEPQYMPRYVAALRSRRVRLIHAFPSALYPLLRWLEQHPQPEFTDAITGVLLTSENVYGFQEAQFARVLPRARIVKHYGHSERVLMATSESADAPYRFMPLYGLPELLDARGQPITQPGVLGELTGTSFDNGVMPFVRYRTGDFGMWAEAPASGEIFERRMTRIEGRLQEFVVCADRRLISITTLGAAHFAQLAQVESIQFEQHEPGRLDLKVVSAAALSDADRRAIAVAVRAKTQGGCEVQVQRVERIERTARGKHRMLIQHLQLDEFLGASVSDAQQDQAVVSLRPESEVEA
jgi:phenylacetate-CoA ligase